LSINNELLKKERKSRICLTMTVARSAEEHTEVCTRPKTKTGRVHWISSACVVNNVFAMNGFVVLTIITPLCISNKVSDR